MTQFSENNSENCCDLGEHLQGVVARYCGDMSDSQKNRLLGRIVDDGGNKKYSYKKNFLGVGSYCIDEKNGKKNYELKELTNFQDWKSINGAYSVGSIEHQDIIKKIDGLVDKFTNNDSEIAKDLKGLLDNSEVHYRVLERWSKPNGSCSFQKANDGSKNQIVICVYDVYKSKEKDEALAQVLAHEFGHALEFSQRSDELRSQYMDGCETAADICGASLLANAGIDSRGFSKFMGEDYKDKRDHKQDTQMLFSPDGKYRMENFDLAYDYVRQTINKNVNTKNMSKPNNDKLKIDKLRGLGSGSKSVAKNKYISKQYSQHNTDYRNIGR